VNRKEIAEAFLRGASAGNVSEAYDKYVHPEFRHHNPYFKGDRLALMTAMSEGAAQFPEKRFEVLRLLQDGDLVAVHSRVKMRPDMPWIAVIHIFRFEGDLIIEEWEAGQQVPTDSPNENGAF
jgi:predicted SnoaL-like aldol condensation-catalyzing enzyme